MAELRTTFQRLILLALIIAGLALISASGTAQEVELKYKQAPADNPLKGLVPYHGQGNDFPHSMEFCYFPMNKLMTGERLFRLEPR